MPGQIAHGNAPPRLEKKYRFPSAGQCGFIPPHPICPGKNRQASERVKVPPPPPFDEGPAVVEKPGTSGLASTAQTATAGKMSSPSPDLFHAVDGGVATACRAHSGPLVSFALVRIWLNHNTSGYASNEDIRHFSHLHVAGTGGQGRYGCIAIVPMGQQPDARTVAFAPSDETARPGYYAVLPATNARDSANWPTPAGFAAS